MTLAEYGLALMLQFAPVQSHEGRTWADPTPEYGLARYTAIADAIATVCDGHGGRRCVSLLVAIGIGESGFARDADEGPCHREGGYKTRCDSGLAASVWQVHRHCGAWKDGRCASWVETEDLFKDRELAARAVYRLASWSLKHCKNLSGLGGACQDGKRAAAYQDRERLWRKIQAWQPVPKSQG